MTKKIRKPEFEQAAPAVEPPAVVQPAIVKKPVPRPAPVVQPKPAKTVKKRIRVRKKTTKHLSVAVLCANPVTRRFI